MITSQKVNVVGCIYASGGRPAIADAPQVGGVDAAAKLVFVNLCEKPPAEGEGQERGLAVLMGAAQGTFVAGLPL